MALTAAIYDRGYGRTKPNIIRSRRMGAVLLTITEMPEDGEYVARRKINGKVTNKVIFGTWSKANDLFVKWGIEAINSKVKATIKVGKAFKKKIKAEFDGDTLEENELFTIQSLGVCFFTITENGNFQLKKEGKKYEDEGCNWSCEDIFFTKKSFLEYLKGEV